MSIRDLKWRRISSRLSADSALFSFSSFFDSNPTVLSEVFPDKNDGKSTANLTRKLAISGLERAVRNRKLSSPTDKAAA